MRSHVLNRIEIKPGIRSDHSLVNFELTAFGTEKGRGLFRFDNRLLENAGFVQAVRQEIGKANACEGVYADVACLGLKFEMLSSEIRVKSSRLSKQRASERREQYKLLIESLDSCEQELGQNPSEETIIRYDALRERINQVEEEKGRLAMIRSGAR